MIPEIIFWFVLFGGFVYFWESVFLPVIRLHLRFKLFELRDRLRYLSITKKDIDRKEIYYVHDAINTTIKILPFFTVGEMWEAHRVLKADSKLRRTAYKRMKAIEDSKSPEIREIFRKMHLLAFIGFFLNSFILLLPFLPLLFIIMLPIIIAKTVSNYLNDFFQKRLKHLTASKSFLTIPEQELQKAFANGKFRPAVAYNKQ